MTTVPEIRYARSGDVSIAYQVVGEGRIDLVFVPFFGNIRWAWEQPLFVRFFERLASFSRLILFDKRGTGLSDRPRVLTLETQMDDIRAVLDAVGSDRHRPLDRARRGPGRPGVARSARTSSRRGEARAGALPRAGARHGG